MSKTTKGSRTSRKSTAKKSKASLPVGITANPNGTYRVRKMINGNVFDKSIASRTKAIAVNRSLRVIG